VNNPVRGLRGKWKKAANNLVRAGTSLGTGDPVRNFQPLRAHSQPTKIENWKTGFIQRFLNERATADS